MFCSAYRWQPPMTNGGVFYSSNEGVTWQESFSGEPVNALYVADNTTWAGIGSDESSGRGMRVRQGPASWWNPGTGLAMGYTDCIRHRWHAHCNHPHRLLRRAGRRLQRRASPTPLQAAGATYIWTNLTPNISYWNTDFTAVTVNPDDPDDVYLSAGNAILRSLDGGTTWLLLPNTGTISHEDVNVLKYDDLLSGTANGIYAYRDIKYITVSPAHVETGCTAVCRYKHYGSGGGSLCPT